MARLKRGPEIDYNKLEENEPYLGYGWAVVMVVLYLLKRLFPAERYSLLWWFEIYVIGVVLALTLFTLYRRFRYFRALREKNKPTDKSA